MSFDLLLLMQCNGTEIAFVIEIIYTVHNTK